jgi:hypothetical protein
VVVVMRVVRVMVVRVMVMRRRRRRRRRATFSNFLVVVREDEGLVPFLLPARAHHILVRNTF